LKVGILGPYAAVLRPSIKEQPREMREKEKKEEAETIKVQKGGWKG
jgi:hypothetical protein